jgi:hypothetical protein
MEDGIGGEWKFVGGVDFDAEHHVSIRLGEISYVRVYALQQNLSSTDFSARIVYRFNGWER